MLLDALRQNPEPDLFLTLGACSFASGLILGFTPIGAALGGLLVGVVAGQRRISIRDEVTWIVFFHFGVGLSNLGGCCRSPLRSSQAAVCSRPLTPLVDLRSYSY